jgi:hypothetical protein
VLLLCGDTFCWLGVRKHHIFRSEYQGFFLTSFFLSISCKFSNAGANNYFTFCSPDYLAMGGGGHFALYLDGDL